MFSRKRRNGSVVHYASFMWNGKLVQELVGTDKRQAEQRERQRKREVAAGTYRPDQSSASTTVAEYVEKWIERRKTRSVADDAARLRLHVVPALGTYRLEELRPLIIRDWVVALRDARKIAPKTVRNVYGVLRTMLRDAQIEELIIANPCVLPRDTLPSPRDRGIDPRRRAASVFTREEVAALISDQRIPVDRRMFYALLLLTGMRHGEAAGRRWRDYEKDAKPLGALAVATQYNDAPLKTDTPRVVPVHPILAERLDEWATEGFERVYVRAPKPDDFIVPSRRGLCRSRKLSLERLQDDCARIGITSRRLHDMRHTFISLARRDGARKDHLEKVTHNAQGDIVDRYTAVDWEPLCEAVACLRIAPLHDAVHDASSQPPIFLGGNQWAGRDSNPGPTD
jgi:integrase